MKHLSAIQANFNRAAANYLDHAQMQAFSAQKLCYEVEKGHPSPNELILDLGSGPGTFCHYQTLCQLSPLMFDLSYNMLKGADNAINGNAENLPFSDNVFDLIISNLMLQWPENKPQVISEIFRVLKPGGRMIFTTLTADSLNELSNSWQKIDTVAHTLNFLPSEEYLKHCQHAGLKINNHQSWQQQYLFPDILSLARHFKQTGTNLPQSKITGLGGRQKWQQLNQIYPKTAEGELPLTYNYLLISAYK